MTQRPIALPAPAFRLKWKDAAYYVSEPNIGDTDCFTADQVLAIVEADRASIPPDDRRGEGVASDVESLNELLRIGAEQEHRYATIIGEVSEALGLTEAEQLEANGADKIIGAIASLKRWRKFVDGLVDIYFDGVESAPENRCYVDGALNQVMDEARSALAATPLPSEPPIPLPAGVDAALNRALLRSAKFLPDEPPAAFRAAFERLAQQWDGCEWEDVPDVGASLRRDLAMHLKSPLAAAATAQPDADEVEQLSELVRTLDAKCAELEAALAASAQATQAGEPVAWIVYLPSMQTQEIFDSQEDAGYMDWLTNYPDAEVIPLYTHPAPTAPATQSAAIPPDVAKLPEITDRSWIGSGQRSALMSKFIAWQEAPVGDASRPFADAIDEHLDAMLRNYARVAIAAATQAMARPVPDPASQTGGGAS